MSDRPVTNTTGTAAESGSARTSRTRLPLVVVMIVSVLAAGFLRAGATAYQVRERGGALSGAHTSSALGSMNSFALALLLGGLRGPLAMVLWATSEAQKADRNLEDFDTKVEWIRLLQPEFDTVHMFQIWNKAYNISVQMASLPNRYATILDAIDYAAEVDKDRPENINIMNAISQVYSNKLGTPHAEKVFYRKWVREQSIAPKDWKPAERGDRQGWQRRRLEPKVDQNGMILAHLLEPKPNRRRPADVPPDSPWNTGAELQYLEEYQPFPYGVSTFALGYNYARRAQVLQSVGKQSPLQVSDAVIDSRPAVELAGWAADEWERGRVFEMQAFGIRAPAERLQMEAPTAAAPPDAAKLLDPASVAPAVYSYQMTERLGKDARAAYLAHLTNPIFFDRSTNYRSHIDTMDAMAVIASADADYLRATVLPSTDPNREKLLANAAKKYQEAIGAYQRIILKWYVTDEVAAATYGDNLNRANIEQQPREVQDRVMQSVRQALASRGATGHDEDIQEYETHIARATTRLGQLLRK